MTNVTNIKENIMGTVSFTAKFSGMRKAQEFIVYPNPNKTLQTQSKDRCATIDFEGRVVLAKCTNFALMAFTPNKFDEIDNIKELLDAVRETAGELVGNSGIIFCENTTANNV